VALGYGLLTGVLSYVGVPDTVLLPLELLSVPIGLAVLFWMLVDVIDNGASILWLLATLFCGGPLVILLYLVFGRD